MVSIIVPVYNVEKYLGRCIDSLINQSYRDIEIILINDGSLDSSGDICDDYFLKDNRITVIHQQNEGVSAARNKGLDIAKGEYIGFCDPDDFVTYDMYEKLMHGIAYYNADISICGYNYYSEEYILDEKRRYPECEDELMTQRDIYSKLSDMPPSIRHGVVNKLFKRSLIKDLKFDTNLKSAEDGDFLLKYLKQINKGIFIHKPLYMNIVRQGSATHGGLDVGSLKASFAVHNRMYEDAIACDIGLKASAIAFLMDVCTLKYNESKTRKIDSRELRDCLSYMRSFLRKKALLAVTSRCINWKTKIYYLLLWIRK